MANKVRFGFERKAMILPLKQILPIRQIQSNDKWFGKYNSVVASIREIGLVEPLVVFPSRDSRTSYLLLDGHLRLRALLELGMTEALCLVAKEDDAFTYNARVNRIALIQEHKMIMKALAGGASEEAIAKALDVDVAKIIRGKNLLDGLHAEAIQILRDKPVTENALRVMKHVKPLRQIEMAQLMVSGNNYTHAYARALLVGTPTDQLLNPAQRKKVPGQTEEDILRMEKEMEVLEREFRGVQDDYGANTLHLGAVQRYIKRLLDNPKVKRFLQQRYAELLEEFQELAVLDAI
ncbi:MAG: plasmid partitioning protein RepB C-terminal domain-containing protein [Nibricoccus sp.]